MRLSAGLSAGLSARACAIVALLLFARVQTSHAQAGSDKRAGATGSIRVVSGTKRVVLSPAELANLPRREVRVVAEGSSDSVAVSGVDLWDVLHKLDIPTAEASGRQRAAMYLRLAGADGQTAVVALVEVDPSFSSRKFLVANQRNGKPLDAVEGPWRVIVPSDLRHARWIRGLVSIEVTTPTP